MISYKFRTQISSPSNDDHFQAYKERCMKLGIQLHQHATPKLYRSTTLSVLLCTSGLLAAYYLSSERQGTLDGTVTRQPRVPPFCNSGLLDYVVELVVSEDDVCVISLFLKPRE